MGCSHEHVLLGDIGATNAQLALLSDGVLGPIKYFSVAEFPRFPDVVDAFFEGDRQTSAVRQAALAVAGPVDEHRCVFTNCPWTIDARELCTEFGFVEVHLCNDFEAAALSLPHLTAADLYRLGGGEAVGGASMAVLGPGSRLGVACLVPGSRGPIAIATEGSHAAGTQKLTPPRTWSSKFKRRSIRSRGNFKCCTNCSRDAKRLRYVRPSPCIVTTEPSGFWMVTACRANVS